MKPSKFIIKIFWGLIFIAGILGWYISVGSIDPVRSWRSLLVSFMFFVSFTGGMVVWPAIVIASNGKWMGKIETSAKTGIVFSIPSIIIMLLLWFGSPHWAPWTGPANTHHIWMNTTFVFVRDLIVLIIFWGLALWYLLKKNTGKEKFSAGILIFTYCIVFSLLGFDLIMPLMPKWKSTLFGGYIFISGLYIAAAGWTLLSLLYQNPDENKRHDLGKLILTFCLLTTYLLFSQLLPIWYENLPREVNYLIPRVNFKPWSGVSVFLIFSIYLGPFVLLIPVWSKRTRWFLGLVSVIILISMWIERWWLISAQFNNSFNFGLPELSAIAALAGITGLGIDIALNSRLINKGFLEV